VKCTGIVRNRQIKGILPGEKEVLDMKKKRKTRARKPTRTGKKSPKIQIDMAPAEKAEYSAAIRKKLTLARLKSRQKNSRDLIVGGESRETILRRMTPFTI
jgi:hypothetical protein